MMEKRNGSVIVATEKVAAQEKTAEQELQDFLKEFDIELLERIIHKKRQPTQATSPLGLAPLDRVHIINDEKTKGEPRLLGVFNLLTMEIGLNIDAIKQEIPNIQDQRISLTHFFIHEQIHASTASLSPLRTGFDRSFAFFSSYRLWNEGVTEKFAREVTQEYLIATGQSSVQPIFSRRYEVLVQFINLFIKRVSEETGVDEDSVWNAIIKANYTTGTITDEDLEGVFPPNFYETLEEASYEDLKKGLDHFSDKALELTKYSEELLREDIEKLDFKKGKLKIFLEKIFG